VSCPDTKPERVIYPTGTCFDDAADYINGRFETDHTPGLERKLVLVHAICHNPDTGRDYAHAWVEEDGFAVYCGILNGERGWFAARVDDYIAAFKARDITRYSCRDLLANCRRSKSTGPWKPEYLALLKKTCDLDHEPLRRELEQKQMQGCCPGCDLRLR
jgi:hypothetical protein